MPEQPFTAFSRRQFLALAGGAAATHTTGLTQLLDAIPSVSAGPAASNTVVRHNVRFQVLSPMLVRMEYVPTGQFIDVPSVSVLNRSWPVCPFEVHDVEGWVEIATSQMRVRYKLDSGKFTPESLRVSWAEADKQHQWKPGDKDDKNLGGVPGLFDPSIPISETPGPLKS